MLSETSVDQIDGVTSNWNVLTITAGGAQFKLECKPAAAKAFAGAFAAVQAAV